MADQWNDPAAQWSRQTANDNANNEYRNAVLAGESEDRALQKAKFAWEQTMDKAGLTGKFEGEWTNPAMMGFANTFGSYGAPTQGQQTQSMQGQMFGQGMQNAMAYGQYFAPGTGPQAGDKTQAALAQEQATGAQNAGLFGAWGTPQQGQTTLGQQQQAFGQDLANRQFGLSQQGQQQQTAQNYLQLLSSLRGPADWAKYQEVLGSTPGGMRDLVGAAMGQYVPGGGATTGVNPQAANLQTMMAQVQGRPITPGMTGGQMQMPQGIANAAQTTQMTPEQQQQAQQFGLQQWGGQQQAGGQTNPQMSTMEWGNQGQDPARQAAYQQQIANYTPMQTGVAQMFQPSAGGYDTKGQQTQEGMQQQYNAQRQTMGGNDQQLNAMGGGTNTMGAQQPGQPQANQMNLPAPNQIAAQSWKNMAPSQQEMLMGAYESQGWHKPDVQALYNQSLPKYAANAPTAGTMRMT